MFSRSLQRLTWEQELGPIWENHLVAYGKLLGTNTGWSAVAVMLFLWADSEFSPRCDRFLPLKKRNHSA